MSHLWGVCDVVGMRPAFLVPVFVDRQRSNALLCQVVSPQGRIRSFSSVASGLPSLELQDPREANVGDHAIWAFAYSVDDVVVGTEAELRPRLLDELRSGSFAGTPMLQLEVARFTRSRRELAALTAGHLFLKAHSRVAAEIWREADVLLPSSRRALAGWLRGSGQRKLLQAIQGLGIRVAGSTLQLQIPAGLEALVDDARFLEAGLAGLREVGRAVGIRKLSLVRRADSVLSRHLPYGVVRGLKGLPSQRARDHHRTLEVPAWPGLPVGTVPEGKVLHPPTFAFYLLGEDGPTEAALEAVEDWRGWDVVTCAIVVSSAWTENGGKDRIQRLKALRAEFDLVISIANHGLELRKRSRVLRPGQRAAGQAESCVGAMLELATSTGAVDRDAFLAAIGGVGIGIFGKSTKLERTSGLESATMSMLDPLLSLADASSYFVLTQGQLKATVPLSRPARIVRIRTRADNGCTKAFAFGIDPDLRSVGCRFTQFCRDILVLEGWLLSPDEAEDGRFTGERNGASATFVTWSAGQGQVEEVGRLIDKPSNVALVTDLTPGALTLIKRRFKVEALHYRDLTTYTP